MDQSDLQLNSLDKDLVDSQPKANQNMTTEKTLALNCSYHKSV